MEPPRGIDIQFSYSEDHGIFFRMLTDSLKFFEILWDSLRFFGIYRGFLRSSNTIKLEIDNKIDFHFNSIEHFYGNLEILWDSLRFYEILWHPPGISPFQQHNKSGNWQQNWHSLQFYWTFLWKSWDSLRFFEILWDSLEPMGQDATWESFSCYLGQLIGDWNGFWGGEAVAVASRRRKVKSN